MSKSTPKATSTTQESVNLSRSLRLQDGRRAIVAAISSDDKKLRYGISLCSVGDQFRKDIGITIAKGRAEKTPFVKTHIPKGFNEEYLAITAPGIAEAYALFTRNK